MYGVRLEAQVHIITGALASVQNLVRCCETAGVKIRDIILEPLASADATLTDDEKELGAFMLDIGGGTSDFAFYQHGTVRHTKVIPLAGELFTQDVAVCLRTPLKEAQRIKEQFGCAYTKGVPLHEKIEVELIYGGHKRSIGRSELAAIIEPRTQELFEILHTEIKAHRLQASAGLVLTGGGSLLVGIQDVAQRVLRVPVRVGKPKVDLAFKEVLESPNNAYFLHSY
jgi:cell division protein FtsA